MEEQIKTSQKHAEEMKMQQATMQAQHDELAKRLEETKAAASNQPAPSAHPQPIIIPFYPPNTRHGIPFSISISLEFKKSYFSIKMLRI